MSIRILQGDCRDVLKTLPDQSVHCVVSDLSETQIAYIAGLIDGEGSLECQRQMQRGAATPIFTCRLSFTFGTAEPITTVAGWLGREPKKYPPVSANRQPRWRFHIKNRVAIPLLIRTLPYLILKRDQAALILAIDGVRALNTVPRTARGGFGEHRRMPISAIEQMQAMHDALRSRKSNKMAAA